MASKHKWACYRELHISGWCILIRLIRTNNKSRPRLWQNMICSFWQIELLKTYLYAYEFEFWLGSNVWCFYVYPHMSTLNLLYSYAHIMHILWRMKKKHHTHTQTRQKERRKKNRSSDYFAEWPICIVGLQTQCNWLINLSYYMK